MFHKPKPIIIEECMAQKNGLFSLKTGVENRFLSQLFHAQPVADNMKNVRFVNGLALPWVLPYELARFVYVLFFDKG